MKIRLHGTLLEVQAAAEQLKGFFAVVSISKLYKDRSESVLYRVYVEIRQ